MFSDTLSLGTRYSRTAPHRCAPRVAVIILRTREGANESYDSLFKVTDAKLEDLHANPLVKHRRVENGHRTREIPVPCCAMNIVLFIRSIPYIDFVFNCD